MGDCCTCAWREDCVGTCLGYTEDDETSEGRAAYLELMADIERDEME